MSMDDQDDDYEVGYGKPPKATQFKKGQSGNPKGRPKGSKSAASIFEKTLYREISIRENGKSRKATQLEAFMMLLTKAALGGDPGAANRLIRLLPLALQVVEENKSIQQAGEAENNAPDITEVDRDVLKHFFEMAGASGLDAVMDDPVEGKT